MMARTIWREVIEHQPLPSAAVSALVRARLAGAEFEDEVTVYKRAGHFCAEFHFVEPIGPEHQASVIVMLGMVPERSDWLSTTTETIEAVAAQGLVLEREGDAA